MWSSLNDAMPLYAVYALLFSDAGLSTSAISLLFLIWSATAVVLEVPTGALADRFTPRATLVVAGGVRAAGYALWILTPTFAGFAAGFVLWGAAGSLESGAFQSLLYSGLDRHGAADRYAGVLGRSVAMAGVVEVGATLAAAPLLFAGGTALVGWVSVAVCLAGSLVAAGFPPTDAGGPTGPDDDAPAGYLYLLRSGVREAWEHAPVRRLVVLLAATMGLTAVDEYVPLLARAAAVPDPWIPVVLAGLPLAAAAGNALAGAASKRHPATVAVPLVVSTALMVVTAATRHPTALLGLVGLWYMAVNLATILADARLQEAVTGPARATVTSVAGLGAEVVAIGMFLAVATLA